MIYLNCDYTEGCHPSILKKLTETNLEQTIGYGMDAHCAHAAGLIKKACEAPEAAVHFLVGGTQTNVTVIDAALAPYQGVICADTGHINVHETGAVEAAGHKCITLPTVDGKITAEQIDALAAEHYRDGGNEHMAQPKMVYISTPTELGTIYKKAELQAIYEVCHKYHMYLFVDGARLGYGLTCRDNDLTLPELAASCDVFYIGGTKVGALFGEAVVITNPDLMQDFRYSIKQHGGMLAKGRLLGIQFEILFEDNLYFQIAEHANRMAERIVACFTKLQIPFTVTPQSNQLFVVLSDSLCETLKENYVLEYQERFDDSHAVMRICTSWATTEEQVEAFIKDVEAALS